MGITADAIYLRQFLTWVGRWWSVGGAVLGGTMLGVGLWLLPGVSRAALAEQAAAQEQEVVVCQPSEETELVVDVSGAVAAPGIYRLPTGSLLADAITQAGGFSQTADTRRIAQTINLARPVTAAEKIYIPEEGEGGGGQTVNAGAASSAAISINTATAQQLEGLTGIGEKRAANIIAGRPYTAIDELVTRDILSAGVFQEIETELTL